MSLIVTPRHLAHLAELYRQLAQLTDAGISLPRALEQISRHPPARSFRYPLARVNEDLRHGYTFSEAVDRRGRWLPAFDVALLGAAEQSGRLDAVFDLLANYYADRARLMRQVISDFMYPAFLFHFAVFILPFPRLFASGNWVAYARETLGVLLPLYAVVLALAYALQGRRGERWRAWVESFVRGIPLVGSARRDLALARLAAALEALISAGVTIFEAWDLAVAASGSPRLRRQVAKWKPRFAAGETPGELITRSSAFPEMFANLYHTGEVSGKLDESLRQLHRIYQDNGTRKTQAIAQWAPRIVYLLVAFMIAWQVISFWLGYFEKISGVGGF